MFEMLRGCVRSAFPIHPLENFLSIASQGRPEESLERHLRLGIAHRADRSTAGGPQNSSSYSSRQVRVLHTIHLVVRILSFMLVRRTIVF